MNSSHWITGALGMVLGAILTYGLTTLNPSADPSQSAQEHRHTTTRLEHDNQSLRQENQRLRNQMAAHQALPENLPAEDLDPGETEIEASYPTTATELGVYVGQLRKAWDEFSAKFPDGRPSPDDENYGEFISTYQQFASEFAVIGIQLRDVMQYQPEERGAFQSSMISEYLSLDPSTGKKLNRLMTDLNQQLSEAELDWSNRPEDQEQMREWYQSRRAFEEEASNLIVAELPENQRQAYQDAFGDNPLSGGMRQLMQGMRSMTRTGGGRGNQPPPNRE
jgi:hypothetical protein